MSMKETFDTKKFWLASFLCVSGVALLFVSLINTGVIAGGVLGGCGELFVTAGAILGIDVVYSNKLRDIIRDMKEEGGKK